MFRRLNSNDHVDLYVLHGASVKGTKLTNGNDLSGFNAIEHCTVKFRGIPFVFHPFLYSTLRRLRPSVILAEGGSNVFNNLIVLCYSRINKTPVIWWGLGELKNPRHTGPMQYAFRGLYRWLERQCSVYLGYSSVAMEYYQQRGYPPERCFLAVNSVDTDRIIDTIEEDEANAITLRKRLGLENKKTALFVGALTFAKRIDRLITAFAKTRETESDARLLIVGDGEARMNLEKMVCDLELTDVVIFVGEQLSGVGGFFKCADVFVLPGLGGLAISEALCHGLPVICTIGDGCEVDLVVNGVTGFRIACDDDKMVVPFIESQLLKLFQNPDLLNQMKVNAKEMVRNKYNIHTYVSGILNAVEYAWKHSPRW